MRFSRWKDKPSTGFGIDYSNPITLGLVSCFTSQWEDKAGLSRVVSPTQKSVSGFFGVAQSNYVAASEINPSVGTLMCHLRIPASPANYVGTEFGFWNGSSDNQSVGFQFDGTNVRIMVLFRKNTTGSSLFEWIGVPYEATVALTFNGSSAKSYKNGLFFLNHTGSGTPLTADSRKRFSSDTGNANWMVKWMYFWNRELTANEILSLYREPYSIFLTHHRRSFVTSVGGTPPPTTIKRRMLLGAGV